jgi:hypothetical protein
VLREQDYFSRYILSLLKFHEMKNLDGKSILLGAAATVVMMALTGSGTKQNSSQLDASHSDGVLTVFSRSDNTVYLYRAGAYSPYETNAKPFATFKISEDGSSVTGGAESEKHRTGRRTDD